MTVKWKFMEDKEVSTRFMATFSEEAEKKGLRQEYIGIRNNKGIEYFTTGVRKRSSTGFDIHFHKDALPGKKDGDEIEFFKATERQYRLYRLLHDKLQRLTLIGLILATVGLLIDTSLAIGQIQPIIIITPTGKVWWMVASLLLTLVGLVLVFWKGVLKDE